MRNRLPPALVPGAGQTGRSPEFYRLNAWLWKPVP